MDSDFKERCIDMMTNAKKGNYCACSLLIGGMDLLNNRATDLDCQYCVFSEIVDTFDAWCLEFDTLFYSLS